jgi:chemotaxis protein MotA
MNTLIPGFVMLVVVMGMSVQGDSIGVYMQLHSFVIVMFGTLAILLFSTPVPVLKSLYRSLISFFGRDETFGNFDEDFSKLLENKNSLDSSRHPLIDHAIDLWRQGIDPELFIVLISQKRKEVESKTHDAVHALKNLSKYPPALGMTGTVIGMINLFSNLDSNKDKIGTNLATAMTATFFGLILTNMIISPLADRLHVRQVNQARMIENIYEILLLINRGEAPTLIKEEMRDRAA